jgi:hypothetical protein
MGQEKLANIDPDCQGKNREESWLAAQSRSERSTRNVRESGTFLEVPADLDRFTPEQIPVVLP